MGGGGGSSLRTFAQNAQMDFGIFRVSGFDLWLYRSVLVLNLS
jgi:hypothetical protein